MTAYNLIQANRAKVETVANTVIEKKEIYGDDLVRLLDAQNFQQPEIDWTAEETWPNLMNFSQLGRARRAPRATTARSPRSNERPHPASLVRHAARAGRNRRIR